MGYCSTLHFSKKDVKMKEAFVVNGNLDGNWYGFYGAKVDEKGDIELDDWCAKFRDADAFVGLYAEKMESGRAEFFFIGEDGERGGFVVEPNAVVEYIGNEEWNTGYWCENGRELYRKLLLEKKSKLVKEIEALDREIEELAYEHKENVYRVKFTALELVNSEYVAYVEADSADEAVRKFNEAVEEGVNPVDVFDAGWNGVNTVTVEVLKTEEWHEGYGAEPVSPKDDDEVKAAA